jgi:hypothetical protein
MKVLVTPPGNGQPTIDFQKNNFAALSVVNGRKRPIPSLLPCEMNFLKVYIIRLEIYRIMTCFSI